MKLREPGYIIMNGLEGKVCIVAGGGGGIGLACARRLAREKAAVVIAGRDGAKLAQAIKLIREEGGRGEFFLLPAADARGAESLVRFTREKLGLPRVLVVSGGAFHEGRLHDLTDAQWEETVESSMGAYFNYCRAVIPAMMEAGGGSVVCISSVRALRGHPGCGPFSAAKGGVISLTIQASVEYAPSDIRFNAVVPGFIKTDTYRKIRQESEPEFEKKLLRHIPMGRIGRVEEVAAMAAFLASDEASYVTGTVIPVDGGYCGA
jgi:NAD(P)-dependent dehydrogenase (short-subunit alcohol dehydrogenase family)